MAALTELTVSASTVTFDEAVRTERTICSIEADDCTMPLARDEVLAAVSLRYSSALPAEDLVSRSASDCERRLADKRAWPLAIASEAATIGPFRSCCFAPCCQ